MAVFQFDNSFARLPDSFHSYTEPSPVSSPRLIAFNRELAEELGLGVEAVTDEQLAAILAGNEVPERAEPLAMAYAGHQFGNFVPQLGDGRAILLGEVIDTCQKRRDIQLKGAGRTPFSRGGDGRSPLGPVLREYLVSEAMHALGVPTTRALGAVTTGETVMRETAQPGAILCRVAAGHVRVGTFEYFAARGDTESVRRLADYVIARHYPVLASEEVSCLALLQAVADRQAALVADWMSLGFIHGVMNTDNMSIAGETIDYGPCAFMDRYHPDTVFSFIDQGGRYAYSNQSVLAQWNLARFAETLLPLLDEDQERAVSLATDIIRGFSDQYERERRTRMNAKLGLATEQDGDEQLVDDLLQIMADNGVDFTQLFRRLADAAENPDNDATVRMLFNDPASWVQWSTRWQQRLQSEGVSPEECAARLRRTNPAVIPRNHLIERAIREAEDEDDFSLFHQLREDLHNPFAQDPDRESRFAPPQPREQVFRTFCGT